MRWIIAMRRKASSLSAVRSKDLARRRERLSQPNVRSTIQRFFCRTNLPRGRETISTIHSHLIHAQSTIDRYAVSAQITLGNFTDSRKASNASFAPSRSCTLAGVTTNAQTKPSVSVTMCRLRPTAFFSRVVAAGPALFGRLDGLAVEHRRGRLGRAPCLASHAVAEFVMNPLPGSVRLPPAEPVEHDRERRQVMRQRSPRAAVTGDVQNGVENLTLRVLRRTTGWGVLGNPSGDPSPLAVRQIRRVGLPVHNANHSALDSNLKYQLLNKLEATAAASVRAGGPE